MRRVFFRRRREGKTDYKARMGLLMSGKPRLVVRKTNRYIIGQIVKSEGARDYVAVGINSKELAKFGWTNSFKNTPAAYLTGLLLGKKAVGEGIAKAVFDIGIQRSTRGSRIYAFLKGAIDAGLSLEYSKDVLPKEERITGRHINEKIGDDIKKIKEKILK